MQDSEILYLIIKAIEKKRYSEAISIIEVLQQAYEERESGDKDSNNFRE